MNIFKKFGKEKLTEKDRSDLGGMFVIMLTFGLIYMLLDLIVRAIRGRASRGEYAFLAFLAITILQWTIMLSLDFDPIQYVARLESTPMQILTSIGLLLPTMIPMAILLEENEK